MSKYQGRNFNELLAARMARGKVVCVGLDPDMDRLWERVPPNGRRATAIYNFCVEIVDATKDTALAYKLNLAFFLAVPGGLKALKRVIFYIHQMAWDVPIILDAKQGDIGNTNRHYVQFNVTELGADAVTIHPYMGRINGMSPYLANASRGAFVLCRTSNDGGAEFQDLLVRPWIHRPTGHHFSKYSLARAEIGNTFRESDMVKAHMMPMYEYVAHRVVESWNANSNAYLVVGATNPEQLRSVRQIVGDMPLLIPGIGAQGGDIAAMVEAGIAPNGHGLIVNVSRGIGFAKSGNPGGAARTYHRKITRQRLLVAAA